LPKLRELWSVCGIVLFGSGHHPSAVWQHVRGWRWRRGDGAAVPSSSLLYPMVVVVVVVVVVA
jgi:hypothetical protein